MSNVSTLELRVVSDGVAKSADVLEKHAKATDNAERAAKKFAEAVGKVGQAAAKESEAWNDKVQKAKARYEKEAEAAERAAARQAAAAEKAAARQAEAFERAEARRAAAAQKAAAREEERWNDQIQKAKARLEREGIGRDGVLPIRPSLTRIEAKLNEQPSSTGGLLAGAVGGAAFALVQGAAEKLSGTMHEVVSTMVEYESLMARLSGAMGGMEEAKDVWKELEEVSSKTIFSEEQLAASFIHLQNVGLEPSMKAMKAYTNIASAYGTQVGEVTNAVAMAAMGNYRSLRQFGVSAKEEGDKLKVTFRGQTTEIGRDAQEIQNYLVKLGEVQFAGAAERQFDTIGGAIKSLDEAWEDLYRTIGQSVIGDIIKMSIGNAAELVGAVAHEIKGLLSLLDRESAEIVKKKAAALKALHAEVSPTIGPASEEATKLGEAAIQARAKAEAMKNDSYAALYEQDARIKESKAGEAIAKARAEAAAHAELTEAIDNQTEAEKALWSIYDKSFSTQDRALIKYQEEIDSLRELAKAKGITFDLEAAEEQAFLNYQREVGGKAPDAKEDKAAEAKRLRDIAEFNRLTRPLNLTWERGLDIETNPRFEQQYRELEKYRESLKTPMQLAAATHAQNYELISETAPEDERDELLKAEAEAYAKKQELAQKAIDDEYKRREESRERLLDEYRTDEERFAAAQDRKLDILRDSVANGLLLEEEAAEKRKQIERETDAQRAQFALAYDKQIADNTALMFGNLANSAKDFGGEQNSTYRTLFAMQKAFAISAGTLSMFQSIAEAWKAGPIAGIPLAIKAASEGAMVLSQISSVNYAGAFDAGGNIPAGMWGDVSEKNRAEIVMRPTRVAGPAQVVGSADTARILGGGQQQPILNVRLVNTFDTDGAFQEWSGSRAGERVISNHIRKDWRTIRSIGIAGARR